MRRDLMLTALAAAASATLYLSLTLGVLGAPFFAYFVQLPLLFVGFSLGAASAGLASLGALGIVILFGGSIAALVFAVVQVGPSLLAIRQSLRNREAPDGSIEWYPPGLVLGHLVLYAAVVMVIALTWVRWATGSLEEAFTAAIGQVLDQFAAAGGQASGLGQQILDYAAIVPGIVAVSWVLMTLVNAAIAQFLALRGGQAQRPTIAFAKLWLPRWCGPALAVTALAALTVGGDPAYFAQGLAALFAVPYLLQGLAVVHSAAERIKARGLALTVFYVVLLLFSWPLVVGVVLLGLLEDWAHFRRRLA
jgi:hypothetical protein